MEPTSTEPRRVVLVIAGSDPCGGAGLQRDLVTLADLGAHGAAVVTVVTAQNTATVRGVWPVPNAMFRDQLCAVVDDLPVCAVKIGLLGSADQVRCIADLLRTTISGVPVVLDPVMLSTTGSELLSKAAVRTMVDELLPVVDLVTPNRGELDRLLAVHSAANPTAFSCATLVTGGDDIDTGENVVDVLWWGGERCEFAGRRVAGREVRGTGCTLSTAIAEGLGRGLPVTDAVEAGIGYVRDVLPTAQRLGTGARILGSR